MYKGAHEPERKLAKNLIEHVQKCLTTIDVEFFLFLINFRILTYSYL